MTGRVNASIIRRSVSSEQFVLGGPHEPVRRHQEPLHPAAAPSAPAPAPAAEAGGPGGETAAGTTEGPDHGLGRRVEVQGDAGPPRPADGWASEAPAASPQGHA